MRLRKIVALVAVSLMFSGCTYASDRLTQRKILTRIDSTKSVEEFSECAALLFRSEIKREDEIIYVDLKNHIDFLIARWEFFPSTGGSQAELRAENADRANIRGVRDCA